MARPTDYLPEYCDSVIEWGRLGKSITWMASEIGITKKTIYNWMEEFPEFLHAIDVSRVHCQKWWEDAGQGGLTADKFNATIWQKNMAARFRDEWTDSQNIATTHAGTIAHSIEFAIVDAISEDQG